jgi:RNA polymerase sigma factor (sigma-70 family)
MNFEQLTYQIKDKLYRFSLRITGNAPEAEDVVQEVFIKVWEKRHDMTDIKKPEAWCMTLTKNLSFDKLRSKHHRPDDISEAYTLSDSKSSPYAEVETNDLMANIRNFMDLLPEKQKLVMHLRDIEGLSYDEIAEHLSMPMPQVKINLYRARTTIREKILDIT